MYSFYNNHTNYNTMEIDSILHNDVSLGKIDEESYNMENTENSIMENSNMENSNMENSNMENSNDTIQEKFHYEIEKAINNGDVKIISNAINKYNNYIDKSYIIWANSIIFQILEEKMDDIVLIN